MSDVSDLLRELLKQEARVLQERIRTADSLSVPCEPGKWRWADVTTDGYHRKSEAELQAMYERNRVLAEETRKRLRLVISVEQELQDVELVL